MAGSAAQLKESGMAALSLEGVYREHFRLLFRCAVALIENEADAEDVLHAVFARLATKSGLTVADPRAYLLRAVRNECVSHRRRSRRLRLLPLVEDVPGTVPGAAHGVNEALTRLAPHLRELVILRVYEGMTFAEIACATGLPRTTARERYGQAIERLRRILER